CAVRDRGELGGLPLSAEDRAAEIIGGLVAKRVERVPEIRSPALIGDVAQHLAPLAVLDLVEQLAGELEIVALLVDAPAAVADDVDAVLDAGEEVIERRGFRIGLQRYVRHALNRERRRALAVGAAVRMLPPDQAGLAERHLIVLEHAVLDDGELGADAAHAVV